MEKNKRRFILGFNCFQERNRIIDSQNKHGYFNLVHWGIDLVRTKTI